MSDYERYKSWCAAAGLSPGQAENLFNFYGIKNGKKNAARYGEPNGGAELVSTRNPSHDYYITHGGKSKAKKVVDFAMR